MYKVHVIDGAFSLPSAHEAFNADGSLKDDTYKIQAQSVGAALAQAIA